MIRVTVELITPGCVKVLGKMFLCNDGGSKTAERSNYNVFVGRKTDVGRGAAHIIEKPLRQGRVENYPRLSYNMWRLIVRGLLACFPEELYANGIGHKKQRRPKK